MIRSLLLVEARFSYLKSIVYQKSRLRDKFCRLDLPLSNSAEAPQHFEFFVVVSNLTANFVTRFYFLNLHDSEAGKHSLSYEGAVRRNQVDFTGRRLNA